MANLVQSFNPRAHTGRDGKRPSKSVGRLLFQSTRPHGARRKNAQTNSLVGVSIHAPTRGATSIAVYITCPLYVSIHAPTRGATLRRRSTRLGLCFNPRAHTGRDIKPTLEARHVGQVSIHAPTRGATIAWVHALIKQLEFQSTRPHGARLFVLNNLDISVSFNPRAHTGRDVQEFYRPYQPFAVSIHAPTRGATVFFFIPVLSHSVSIHAPTRGATLRDVWFCLWIFCFNPRAHTGRDQLSVHCCKRYLWFQSTRPHGARLFRQISTLHSRSGFNPRAHTGRDCCCSTAFANLDSFNPRAHTGRDRYFLQQCTESVFQSTRPHGARPII